jgi:hypothetical protein
MRRTFQWLILLLLLAALLMACSRQATSNPVDPAGATGSQPTPLPDCYEESSVIGQSISDTFDVPYEKVMSWFCAGHTYDDILLALQTAQTTDVTPDDLLQRKADGQSWDEIWQAIGLTD